MKINKLLFASLLSVFFLMSCSEDDTFDPIQEDDSTLLYDSGFFVLNEGNSGGGTITYISDDLQTVEQNVYTTVNHEEELDLGLYLQSMFFHEDKAYIISNGSNLITVVNRYTFELVGKVTGGLDVPRYGTVANGKAYVTNQASFGSSADDYIAVINLETLEVEESILANAPVEFIKEENDKLYIQNATYGTGNQISVLDPTTNSIAQTILVGDGLNSFEIENNTLYALSSTKIEKVNLSTLEVTTWGTFPTNFGAVSNLEVEDGKIYFTVDKSVYSMPENATSVSTTALFSYTTESAYGAMYGFEVEDNHIYIADGGDFASDSFIEVYNLNGELLEKINVGVAPNGFYFND